MSRSQQETKNIPALAKLHEEVAKLTRTVERARIADYVQLLDHPRKLIFANLIAGIARGVGIAIGLTVFAGTILYFLRMLGALDLPIIGGYIAEIVKVVQAQLEGRRF
ncbi:MAG TPA: DUF5665 domain-containing protein [Bacilli bacterium]